jgi:hypothetical protein
MWDGIDVGLILSEGIFDRAIVGSNDILGMEEGDWVGLNVVSGGEMNTIGAEDAHTVLFPTFVDLDDLPLYDFEEEEDNSVVNDGLFALDDLVVVVV